MTWHKQAGSDERPPGIVMVAMLLAAFAVLAAGYAAAIASESAAFNSGGWVVGEELAMRGWLGYALFALLHLAGAIALWQGWRGARWAGVALLLWGLFPAVPAISAAVVDLRVSGIALWGALIVARTAGCYALLNN